MASTTTSPASAPRAARGVPGAWLALLRAPDHRMRRVDLAEHVLLTQSGITRLLQGLERAGLVERADCPTDGRVVYAQLTQRGYDRLRESSRTHLDDIRSLFAARFSSD